MIDTEIELTMGARSPRRSPRDRRQTERPTAIDWATVDGFEGYRRGERVVGMPPRDPGMLAVVIRAGVAESSDPPKLYSSPATTTISMIQKRRVLTEWACPRCGGGLPSPPGAYCPHCREPLAAYLNAMEAT